MSAITHVPGSVWAGTHRLLLLVVATLVVAAAITATVLLLDQGPTAASPAGPDLPSYSDTCTGALPGSPC